MYGLGPNHTLGYLHHIIERSTGLSIPDIQHMTLSEMRDYFEKKLGRPLRFTGYPEHMKSEVDSREINRTLDAALASL